jgi:hypothetical protein
MAEWTSFQTHCYSINLVAPVIEPGNSESVARKSDDWTTEAVVLEDEIVCGRSYQEEGGGMFLRNV